MMNRFTSAFTRSHIYATLVLLGHDIRSNTLFANMTSSIEYLRRLPKDREIEVTTLLDCVLTDAAQAGASDIHIEPWEQTLVVRVRLDGVLSELVHLPLEIQERFAARCKVIAGIESYQTGLPQEGHVEPSPERGHVDFRVSVLPAVRGEKIVIRLFDRKAHKLDLEGLGFDDAALSAFTQLLARPSGLILLTGPTGSGKTTVMYSSLTHITHRAGPAVSISTVEDPVEVWLPMITQSQINHARGFTYPIALRALLRQDPQVMMIGEIRDLETASIALQAGLTGHLVISTIHSGSSAGVFARLINMDVEPFLLASSVAGVLSVRLVRRNCTECRIPTEPEGLLRAVPAVAALPPDVFRRGQGCNHCYQTGFSGRVLVTELLTPAEPLREAVLRKLPSRELHRIAMAEGMGSLWQTGLRHVLRGEVAIDELARVVPPESVS